MSSTISRRWPAEWEPHDATIILWPHNPGTFRTTAAAKEFGALIRSIAAASDETVHVLLPRSGMEDDVRKHIEAAASADDATKKNDTSIRLHVCPSNDSWARDTAPTFVVDTTSSTLIGLDWDFNSYGGPETGCYWPCPLDQGIAAAVCKDVLPSPSNCEKLSHLILEGGSIHTDGQGTILTTKECLLVRNPTLSQSAIENMLLKATGCHTVVWLEHGLAFDEDTNGHVDNWCCFVQPGVVVLAWTDDKENDAENYQRCRNAFEQLQAQQGSISTIHKLYLPAPLYYSEEVISSLQFGDYNGCNVFPREVGERMAASYVNFYIANGLVVVPQFGDEIADKAALETLRPLFPDRHCVGINSLEILIGGGNIHCVTQQVPKVRKVRSSHQTQS